MNAKKLTKKEQDTIWGLINCPTLTDKELAKKTRLKLSTVTAIRRRLRDKDYYWTVNIPNFYQLGFELMSIEYGSFNEAVPAETRSEHFRGYLEGSPHTVFSLMSRSHGIVINVARNYAESNMQFEDLQMYITNHRLTEEGGWKRVIFPFQTSMFWNFFDFSPVFRYSYDIKRKINLTDFVGNKNIQPIKLSKKEKKVLYGLVKFPEESDNSIADRFGVSRQAVSNIKKRFQRDDIISPRRIINFEHTGCSLLTFAYTFFGTRMPMHSRQSGLDFVKKTTPVFFGISSNFENVIFIASKEYSDYEKLKEKLLSFYKTHLSIAKPPEIMLFPVDDIRYLKRPTFHGLLEDIAAVED